jgi:hypothetical protein
VRLSPDTRAASGIRAPPLVRTITGALRATVCTPDGMYWHPKMTAHLRHQEPQVAACSADRPTCDGGLSGGAPTAPRFPAQGHSAGTGSPAPGWHQAAPNRKRGTDFTYRRMWSGFAYVTFAIDCFSRAVIGWHDATMKDSVTFTTALKTVPPRRRPLSGRAVLGYRGLTGRPQTATPTSLTSRTSRSVSRRAVGAWPPSSMPTHTEPRLVSSAKGSNGSSA